MSIVCESLETAASLAALPPKATAAEVSQFLRVSKETLSRWVRHGKFPPPDFQLTGAHSLWLRETIAEFFAKKGA